MMPSGWRTDLLMSAAFSFARPVETSPSLASLARMAMPPAIERRAACKRILDAIKTQSARPRPLAVEPSSPTCLSPAVTGSPELGANCR